MLVSYQDGTLRHIGSSNYFRVGDFVDDDLQVGHGIGYPFYQPDRPESLNNPALIHPPQPPALDSVYAL